MFKIYHSNQLTSLTESITYIIKNKPFINLFEKEIILTQNLSISQWLQIELTKQLGITFNIYYELPSTFIWNMFHNTLSNIPKKNNYTKHNIKWKLLTILPKIIISNEFDSIRSYFEKNINNLKMYQFSNKVSSLFEKYIIFRPNLIKHWENNKLIYSSNKNQLWQKKLWQEVVLSINKSKNTPKHIANLYQIFIKSLLKSPSLYKKLPKRIFIFGISSLPPLYINILNVISKYTDIHLMFLNPSKYYLNNFKNTFFLNKSKQQKQNYNNKLLYNIKNNNNTLLNLWGKTGYEYLYLISKIKKIINIYSFINTNKTTLLENLKQNILDSKNNIQLKLITKNYKKNKYKQIINHSDKTLSFHSCHSAQREIEVLYNKLLSIFEENKSISPKDIIVMAPDINNYISDINAIFNNINSTNYIPFFISDIKIIQTNPILKTFFILLKLPGSRFSKNQVFSLLETTLIANKFNINENELNILYRLADKYEIKYGLDDNNLHELNLPIINQNTWEFGLKQILSDCDNIKHNNILKNILSHEKYNENAYHLINKLILFINTLRKWNKILNQKHSLAKWKNICQKLIYDFFLINNNNENILIEIIKEINTIINTAIFSNYKRLLDVHIIYDELFDYFNNKIQQKKFLINGVTFCSLSNMHSIPFKVICLLGMNNDFPNIKIKTSFDLINNNLLIGDNISKNNNQYFFLESLISAKKIFYISYIGVSIYNNQELNPSILVEELLNYICQNFCLEKDQNLNIEKSSKNLKKYLITKHCKTPFDPKNFIPKKNYQSYANEWLSTAKTVKIKNKQFIFSIIKKKLIKKINIEQLLCFYQHPIKFFFEKKLNINFFIKKIELIENEPFTINKFKQHKIKNKIIEFLIKNKNPKNIYNELRLSGKLPIGNFGRLIWKRYVEEISLLSKNFITKKEKLFNYSIKCTIKNIKITGVLKNINKTGIIRYEPFHLTANNIVQLWIEHLFYNFLIKNNESIIFYFNNKILKFSPIKKEIALHYIEELITGFCNGQNSPLLLLNNDCWNWLKKCFNKKTQRYDFSSLDILQKAKVTLIDSIQENQNKNGEIKDIYLSRIYKRVNNTLIQILIKNTKQYLFPIISYIK